MPDQSDVETALAAAATLAIYPGGAGTPSVTGDLTRVFRGWPNAAALDTDLAAGRVNITIFPVPGEIRDTTRYPMDWQTTPVTATLFAAVEGTVATFTGTADAGQLAGIRAGNATYVHRTAAGDTPALVAAILATAIAAHRPALAAGASVSVPGALNLIARVAVDTIATSELRRQTQTFRLTTWCPTPATRDAAASAIDAAFALIPFLAVASTACRLRYVSATTFDQSQDAALYRRDLLYSVEFPTLAVALQPAMLFGLTGTAADGVPIATLIS